MNHAIFPGIPVVAIGLALSVELKVYWAMIGHDEQLFRWVWCRKTPASEIQGRTQTPLDVFARLRAHVSLNGPGWLFLKPNSRTVANTPKPQKLWTPELSLFFVF